MRMFCLSASDVKTETIWNDVREHFERFADERGEITPDQIRESAASSHAQIWGLQDSETVHAVVVTEIKRTAKGLRCEIWVAHGGAPVPVQERLLDEIGKWAREAGCYAVRIIGRKGWMRRFPRFKPVPTTVMEWRL